MKGNTARRRSAAFLAMALATGGVLLPSRPAGAQGSLSGSFDELVTLVRAGQWGPMEWARGSYLAVQITRYGKSGAPYMRGRFARAAAPEECFLSGVYVVTYGEEVDQRSMRQTLEMDARKRVWLRAMVGNGEAMRASMSNGAQWQPALRLLPALGGCRSFCRLCAQSGDVLVRRAGLYWGFWVADASYWKQVYTVASGDPDPLTRQFAAYLYGRRPAAKPK